MLLFSSPGSITSGFSFKILLLMIVLEALSRKMKSGYPEQLLYADISAMVSESTERLKGKLETSKGALEVLQMKRADRNVKKKIIIRNKKARNVRQKGEFLRTFSEKAQKVISSSASFTSVGCKRDVVVLEID